MTKWSNSNELCDIVRQTSFEFHCDHRCGRPEKIHENALVHRLPKAGLKFAHISPR